MIGDRVPRLSVSANLKPGDLMFTHRFTDGTVGSGPRGVWCFQTNPSEDDRALIRRRLPAATPVIVLMQPIGNYVFVFTMNCIGWVSLESLTYPLQASVYHRAQRVE